MKGKWTLKKLLKSLLDLECMLALQNVSIIKNDSYHYKLNFIQSAMYFVIRHHSAFRTGWAAWYKRKNFLGDKQNVPP